MHLDKLSIIGHDNLPLPHRFVRQESGSDHLAIIFPGFSYGSDSPALYYPARLLGDLGAEVLMLGRLYSNLEGFRSLSEAERARTIVTDGLALCNAGLNERPYRQITLVGKSIGTLTMARLLKIEPRLSDATCIWLTPLVKGEKLREIIVEKEPRSLFIFGSADEHYEPSLVEEVVNATEGKSFVIEGANHSLEIAGKLVESIRQIGLVVEEIEQFVLSRR